MVSLAEGWKKYFQRTTAPAEAAPEQILLDQLATQLQTPEETLIPDPDWIEEPESRQSQWQRPVLFMIACALFATALGYTLTKDWWVARQQQNLERNLERTATSLRQQAGQTTTQIQDGLEQLLPPEEPPPIGKFLPPAPAIPSVQFAPPALRQLPPAPAVLPPIQPLPTPPVSRETVRVSLDTRPKIALIGGNQNVVLLSVGGERMQMVPGQTGPDGLAVVSIRTTTTHYRVGLRLGDGHPLELSIAYAAGGAVNDPVAPIRAEDSTETITPIF